MKLIDCHNDFITELKTQEEKDHYIAKIKKYGIKTMCSAVFTSTNKLTLKEVLPFANEISRLRTKYGVNLIFTVEDLGFLKMEDIDTFINLRPFSVNLTWHYKNKFAGGDRSKLGLTKLGKDVIKKLEINNVFIDTAHLSRKSFWDFAKITTRPIYNSHSNIYSLHRHNRNLTDQQLKIIVETNGFLGLTIYDDFIAGKPITSFELAKQFDYLIKNFGYLNFGLGTDFYGIEQKHLPTDVKNYLQLKTKLKYHLLNMGYSKKVIEALMYKNFEDFLLRNKLK